MYIKFTRPFAEREGIFWEWLNFSRIHIQSDLKYFRMTWFYSYLNFNCLFLNAIKV